MTFAAFFHLFEDYQPLADRPLDSVVHDGISVTFWFKDGKGVRYPVEADCCSSSWIEHITIPSGIEGKTITGVKDARMKPHTPVAQDSWEFIAVYHTAFATDAGEIIVEYRNSSNGYYGGWLGKPQEVTR